MILISSSSLSLDLSAKINCRSHTHTHTHVPAYKTALMAGRRSETHTHTRPCLQDRTDGWSPVRDRLTPVPAYKTTQMSGRRSETHIHTSLPTRPHRWLVAGQRHTYTRPCLQDHTDGWSPVRDTHTHFPAYKTAQMAGRRSETHIHTHTRPSLQDHTDGWLPVRDTHTHTSLPTRPHRWLVAGQRHTYTRPCLQDRTDGWSPVRDTHTHTHTHIPAYKTTLMAGRRSETHTHTSLPTRPHRWLVAGQRHTHTRPCLQDRTDGRSPVRDTGLKVICTSEVEGNCSHRLALQAGAAVSVGCKSKVPGVTLLVYRGRPPCRRYRNTGAACQKSL